MEGVGVREASWEAQRDVSSARKVVSLDWGAVVAAWGVRREMVSTLATDGLVRRALRMCVPLSM